MFSSDIHECDHQFLGYMDFCSYVLMVSITELHLRFYGKIEFFSPSKSAMTDMLRYLDNFIVETLYFTFKCII